MLTWDCMIFVSNTFWFLMIPCHFYIISVSFSQTSSISNILNRKSRRISKQTSTHTNPQTNKQTCKQTNTPTPHQTNKHSQQTNTLTNTPTHIHSFGKHTNYPKGKLSNITLAPFQKIGSFPVTFASSQTSFAPCLKT